MQHFTAPLTNQCLAQPHKERESTARRAYRCDTGPQETSLLLE